MSDFDDAINEGFDLLTELAGDTISLRGQTLAVIVNALSLGENPGIGGPRTTYAATIEFRQQVFTPRLSPNETLTFGARTLKIEGIEEDEQTIRLTVCEITK